MNPGGTVVVGYQPAAKPNPALWVKDIKVIAATQTGAVVVLLQGPRPAAAQIPSDTDPDVFLDIWASEQGTWRMVARQGVWVTPPASQPPARIKAPAVSPYQAANMLEGEIFKAHQAIEDAFVRYDGASYERLTTPEFVRIGERGQVLSRSEWIKANVAGKKVVRVAPLVEDVRIRVYGDVAVMTHRHIARDAEGTTWARPLRMMRAWVKRADGWKLAATISTIVWPTPNR
jgi:hypothetical protein